MRRTGRNDVHDPSRARIVQGLRALHSPYEVHGEDDGLLMTICSHCCTQREQGQTEDCVSDHDHLPDHALCPTMAIVEGLYSPWNP